MIQSILIISPENWSHIFVSKHHYAVELAKRNYRVYFLNPPQPVGDIRVKAVEGQPNLFTVDYPGQWKGLRFYPRAVREWRNRVFLRELEKKAGTRIDLVWNFENSRFFDLGFAGDRFTIYHQVDLNQDFNVKQAASSADICFCTSDLIRDVILPWNKRVFKIHHGCSVAALQFPYTERPFTGNEITALYIGNIDMPYMDMDLLVGLVDQFSQIRFAFVGPYDENGATYRHLHDRANVSFEGRKKASEIPVWLDRADLLLVLYAEKYHRDQSSPHKFMEYFASGRVIVATYTDEYKDKQELLAMSRQNSDYIGLFKEVVDNLPEYNSADRRRARFDFARENTYDKQVDRIISHCQDVKPGLFS